MRYAGISSSLESSSLSFLNLSKRVFSEDFDVVVDGNIIDPEKESDVQDDQRFNTEKHHKQQHKF